MSVLALVNPATLLGQGVREALGVHGKDHEIRLLSSEAEAEGTLTEIAGEVALVHALTTDALTTVDLVIACGTCQQQQQTLALVPEGTKTIVVANEPEHPAGELAIAGITDPESLAGNLIVSPHPGVVALGHLLAPLRPLRPRRATATLLLPASMRDTPGLDELFAQTRDVLNFQTDWPKEIFGHQLAFNILPVSQAEALGTQVVEVLGSPTEIAIQLLQAPVFHCLGISAIVELGESSTTDDVHDALHDSRNIAFTESTEILGPLAATASEELLIGPISPIESWPGAYAIWAAMDNLTRGGASNAIDLVKALLT